MFSTRSTINLVLVSTLGTTVVHAQPRGNLFELWGDRLPVRESTAPDGYEEERPDRSAAIAVEEELLAFPFALEMEMSPYALPDRALTDPLEVQGARAEYVSMTFGVYAGRDLSGLFLKVGSLIKDDRSDVVIPPEHIDVRLSAPLPYRTDRDKQLYTMEHQVLVQQDEYAIPGQQNRKVWINVWLPPETPAGTYLGECVIRRETDVLARVELKLTVLPITLGKPGVLASVWYTKIGAWEGTYDKNTPDHLAQLAELGFNSIYQANNPPGIIYRDGKIEVDTRSLERLMDAYMAAGMDGPVHIDLRYANGWSSNFGRIVDAHQKDGKDLPAELKVAGGYEVEVFDHPATREAFVEIVRQIERSAEQNGWPDRYYFVQEEATAKPARLEALHYFLPLLPEQSKAILVSNGPRWGRDEAKEVAEHLDARCYSVLTREVMADAKRLGQPLDIYNVARSEPRRFSNRVALGFYPKRVGIRGVSQWAYIHGSPSDFFFWPYGHMVHDSPDGPIPTSRLLKMAEGIDDSRYLALLDDLINRAKASEAPAVRGAAADALRNVSAIMRKLPVEGMEFFEFARTTDPKTYDAWRSEVVESILTLQAILQSESSDEQVEDGSQ